MHLPVCLRRVIGFAAVACATAASTLAEDNPLVAQANAWKQGQQIPRELLTFRDSDACLASPTDTIVVFDAITNHELFRAILSHRCDDRVFECAVKRSLSLVGPSRFFHDLEQTYASIPQLLSQPRHRALKHRATLPHVWVDGMFIDDRDMSRDKTESVFAEIGAELRAGKPFDAVRKKYHDAYEYTYTETLSDGAKVVLHRTRVGNYGDFVVSEAEHTARPLRFADLPREHVRPLLSGRAGDVIVLRDESEHRTVLYQVRDAYSPKRPHQAMQQATLRSISPLCTPLGLTSCR